MAVKLPKKCVEPAGELNDFNVLIYGPKKIGKTSLSLQGGRVLLLQFDPPQIAYRRMEIHCPTWSIFTQALKELRGATKGKTFPYDRIVVDGAGTWYQHCYDHVCKDLGISHPGDLDYGEGWLKLKQVFTKACDQLMSLPCGIWFLCHSQWKEVKTRSGKKIERLVPALGSQAETILNAKVDAWFAYDWEGDDRILVLRGDEVVGAGHRMTEEGATHFVTPKGRPIKWISMGDSPKSAYRRLQKAFDNKQKRVKSL